MCNFKFKLSMCNAKFKNHKESETNYALSFIKPIKFPTDILSIISSF